MSICLKSAAKQSRPTTVQVKLEDRLPFWVNGVSDLICTYKVESVRDYYRLQLQTKGKLSIICQRCLETVEHEYEHESDLYVCRTDEVADRILSLGESIVAVDDQINLSDILTDDLYLFAPDKPHDLDNCKVNF